MISRQNNSQRQSGFSMIEVLVTLVILLVGLLGLAGLMVQSQRSEMESYQRVQAIVLLQDMYGRVNANRKVPACYALTNTALNGTPYLGVGGVAAPACASGTAAQNAQAQRDMSDWSTLLTGAAESLAGGNVGAMVGARGCISYDATSELLDVNAVAVPGTGVYTIAVAWQGMGDTFAPPISTSPAMNCGKGLYGAETKRRVVSLTLRTASLTAP